MHAFVVRCPQCHASLKVDDTRPVTRCEYCGTEARIQRRTAFGMKVELPKNAPKDMPIAVEAARRVAAVVGFSTVFVVVLLIFVFTRSGSVTTRVIPTPPNGFTPAAVPRIAEPPSPESASSPPRASWNGGGEPVFVDVNGDGARDAVGIIRYVLEGDHMNLGAVDAKTGKLAWQGESLGSYTEVYQGRIYATPSKLLFAHPRGELWGFEPKTGVRAWMRQLGERVTSVCDAGGQMVVSLANNQWLDLDLGSGQITPRKRPAGCKKLRNTDDDEPKGGPDVAATSAGGGVPGMDRGEVMGHTASGVIVVSGSRTPGTSVPMLARMVDKKPAWKVEVPSEDVMNARAERFCVSGERACSVYDTDKSGVRITCFGVADGARAWDQVLGETHVVIRGLADVDGTVFLSTWGKLFALDGATGKPRYVFGN